MSLVSSLMTDVRRSADSIRATPDRRRCSRRLSTRVTPCSWERSGWSGSDMGARYMMPVEAAGSQPIIQDMRLRVGPPFRLVVERFVHLPQPRRQADQELAVEAGQVVDQISEVMAMDDQQVGIRFDAKRSTPGLPVDQRHFP